MTKPGNSGSEEPKKAEAPEAAETPAEPVGEEKAAEAAEKPAAQTPAPHESPTGASGGPPNSTLPESTDNSGSGDVAAEPAAEKATEPQPTEAKPAEDKPSAKARRAKAAEAEPLMAELEKAPPPPREQALRAQAKRRFEEPPPRTLRFSLYFFVAAGGIWLLSMVASLIYKQDIINNEIKRNTNTDITPDQIASAVNQILWIVTIAALAFTVFLALFGYKATEGTRRARTLVTIFAAVLVLFHLLLNGTQLGILSAMFALVGLALLWSPSARKYFPPRQVL